ncbi:MAG: hypothetical protein WBA46_14005 [Thermomicrobiales bacterium]
MHTTPRGIAWFRLIAMLALLFAGGWTSGASAVASPTAPEASTFLSTTASLGNLAPATGEMRDLSIRSSSCSDAERTCWDEVGAHFTVTTEGGDAIGDCTLEASSTSPNPGCTVSVPVGGVVVVTQDNDSITAGFAPRSNPIRFDTAVEPRADCHDLCFWGPTFSNGPKSDGAPSSGSAGTGDMMVWAGEDDAGVRISVATEGGDPIGECSLDGPTMGRTSCTIPVPLGTVVIVTEDETTLAPGLAPESNPIRFDTGVEPFTACAPCHWGPDFRNGPRTTASTTDRFNSTATQPTGAQSSSGRTWSASVQVMLCDAAPGSGADMNCSPGVGVTVDISLASGGLLGSCTTGAAQPTPWGTEISLCGVDGLPFNADFVATQDPSTIPAGYAPSNDPQTLHVTDAYPGGGDQATFTFVNVRTGSSGSSGDSTGTSGTDQTGSATLLMTFRACPEGFDPNAGDFWAECTIPLDAPDASIIVWGGDGQGGMSITQLARQGDGTYVYDAGPGTMNLHLSGLAPVVRDSYQVFGADGGDGAGYTVNLTNGEVRQVFIFYYYG